jgi:hypothetical protein
MTDHFVTEIWKTIRLELARTRDYPNGSPGRAYMLHLPLDGASRVDEQAVLESPGRATFSRHWASDPDESGHLHRCGQRWLMRSPGRADRSIDLTDWPLRLEQHISLFGEDGMTLPLRVVSVV